MAKDVILFLNIFRCSFYSFFLFFIFQYAKNTFQIENNLTHNFEY